MIQYGLNLPEHAFFFLLMDSDMSHHNMVIFSQGKLEVLWTVSKKIPKKVRLVARPSVLSAARGILVSAASS